MDTSEKIVCRPATHADCDATMAINRNVYHGLDYLLHKFHDYVDDPLRFPFVAVSNGTIVGYKCGYVIDAGTSIVSEANRVHPDYQGKGIMTLLDNVVLETVQKHFNGSIQRTIWTAVDLERAMAKVNRNSNVKLLTQRPRVTFDSTCDALQELCANITFQELAEKYKIRNVFAVPRRLGISILSTQIDFKRVVPEGMLLVNFEPWGLHRQTFIELLKTSTFHISSVVPQEGMIRLSNSFCQEDSQQFLFSCGFQNTCSSTQSLTNQERKKDAATLHDQKVQGANIRSTVQCLSFHTVSITKNGARVRVDFYCPPDPLDDIDINLIAAGHLLYHIREAAVCNQNMNISFSLLFGQHVDKAALKRLLTEQLGLHATSSPESAGLLLTMSCS